MTSTNSVFSMKAQKCLHDGVPKLQSTIKKEKSIMISVIQKEFYQSLTKKIPLIREKIMKADYLCFTNSVVNEFQKS